MARLSTSALVTLALAMAGAPSAEAAKLKNVVYFMEWSTYDRKFDIFDLDWSKITHVNYAFGKPNPDGTVGLYDKWSAIEKRFPDHGDSWNEPPTSAFGQFGQGNKLKKQFRGTKFGLSIGGWTLSDQFSSIASTEQGRRTFAKSSVALMLELGLDFIDIDWEYPVEGGNDVPPVPHRPDDIKNYVLLLKAIRDEFKTVPFAAELSVASPAGSPNYRHWDFAAICGELDHINIMTYDLTGSWSDYTDHQANLYEDPNHPKGLVYSVDGAIQDYIKGGCPSDKIVMGIPAYGRSFENSNGIYTNFTKPTKGSWVSGNGDGAGIWDYKALPQAGATEFYDEKLGAAYSYDPTSKTFISYDSPKSLSVKLDYIKKYNLGGAMFWSGDADAPTTSPRSLISQVYNAFGKENMDFHENNINYPNSKYDNIRNGSTPPSPSTSSPATSTPVTSAPTTSAPVTSAPTTPAPSSSKPVTSKPTTAAPVTPAPSSSSPATTQPTSAPSTSAPVTARPTAAPVTPSPTAAGKCDDKSGGLCYWPFNKQVLPFTQVDCVKFTEFVWCP